MTKDTIKKRTMIMTAEEKAKQFLKEFTGNRKWDGVIHYGDQGQHDISLAELLAGYHQSRLQTLKEGLKEVEQEFQDLKYGEARDNQFYSSWDKEIHNKIKNLIINLDNHA